jgi:hypothetical protein
LFADQEKRYWQKGFATVMVTKVKMPQSGGVRPPALQNNSIFTTDNHFLALK